jgi:hypothetical protein
MTTCETYTFIAIIILYIFGIIYLYQGPWSTYFSSTRIRGGDGVWYKIQGNMSDKEMVLQHLMEANRRIVILGKHLKKKYRHRKDICQLKLQQVTNLLKRYNPDKLIENSPKIKGESSYTLSKGELVAMCLRDKKTFEVHSIDIIMFVYLHELAHIATDVRQHEFGFWQTFKWLLQEAEEAGVYKNVDFRKSPITYCGHYVDYSPYFDQALTDLCAKDDKKI